MKLNIFAKLFLAVLIATVIVIAFMVTFMNWSFRQGFADYQHQAELARVNVLAEILVRDYQQQGNSWGFLRNNPRGWQSTLLKLGEAASVRSLSKHKYVLEPPRTHAEYGNARASCPPGGAI